MHSVVSDGEPVSSPRWMRQATDSKFPASFRDAGHKCPVDNEILLENQLFPDNFAKREILSLTVKCPNKGCVQKMELRHLEVSRVSSSCCHDAL